MSLTTEQSARRDGSALRQMIARRASPDRVDLEPGCAYGVVTRQMVDTLLQELRVIRGRVDSLFSLVVGAIVLDVLLRLAGWR